MKSLKEIAATDSAKTILFIGNSLTYANDIPGLVAQLGKENGAEITTEMIAHPDYTLEDHWNSGQLQNYLAGKHYDFVIVQQGACGPDDDRIILMDFGTRISRLCKKNNSRLAFFMVWPDFSNLHTFDRVIRNYNDAAIATNALLCPIGQLWRQHFLETGNYSYYSSDKFHPSKKGSKVAALIIFETLLNDLINNK